MDVIRAIVKYPLSVGRPFIFKPLTARLSMLKDVGSGAVPFLIGEYLVKRPGVIIFT